LAGSGTREEQTHEPWRLDKPSTVYSSAQLQKAMAQSHCRQMYQKVISGQQISTEQERERMDGSHEVKCTVAENATRDRQAKLNGHFLQK